MIKMKKISRKGSHDCHVILESMDDIYDKLDELVEGHNEIMERLEGLRNMIREQYNEDHEKL